MKKIKHIEINIGKACNNKCRFCMSSKPELYDMKFVELDKLKDKLKLYSEKGYNSVGFLGGDVSIYPNLVEIIKYCKFLLFTDIQIITNGMRFDDINYLKSLVFGGLTRINISIHSHNEKIEDFLTGVSGGLNRKLKAIDNINYIIDKGEINNPLSINIVLNSYNIKSIVETVLYFYKVKKITDIRINFIWLDEDIKENWDELKISYTQFLPYLKKLIYISLKYEIRITFDTVPACIFYKVDKLNYISLINKFLGEEYDYINEIDWVNKNRIFDWKKTKLNKQKTKFDKCNLCKYNSKCEGVWKSYYNLFGDLEFINIL